MKVVINHLTRMQSGYICAAGVDVHAKQHVRLMPARGHLRPELLAAHGGLFDMAVILEVGPTKRIGAPPEIEDREFDLRQTKFLGVLAPHRFWNMLTQMAQPKLTDIFGDALRARSSGSCAVEAGKGKASLGCLTPARPPELLLRQRPDKPAQVRLRVSDGQFDLDLAVTDIRLYGPDHATPDIEAIEAVASRLRSETVILSVGLTRPYTPSDNLAPMHWLQVNNIHFR